jgi:hypothetical protein
MQRRRRIRPTERASRVADRPEPTLAQPKELQVDSSPSPTQATAGQLRRLAARSCAWCGTALAPKPRGRIPKWCSASCRQRAWEQARAAASGRSAVEVVERQVETPVPMPPTRRDWPRLLGELVNQLDGGRVYDRDLDELSVAVAGVLDAMDRRIYIRSRTTPRPR